MSRTDASRKRSIQTRTGAVRPFRRPLAGLAAAGLLLTVAPVATSAAASAETSRPGRPTVVLVHGAFAESASWSRVIGKLAARGYPTIAVANPLRAVRSDADYVRSVLRTVKGPIVLVGHSYGGAVITSAANGVRNVEALVYVAGFAPDRGESASALARRFPGSTLGGTLAPPVALPGGGKDLYIRQDRFRVQFAADVPVAEARVMAATQRPITEAALNERSGAAAWRRIPSWFVYGERDRNIPAAAHAFMARRAGAKEVVAVKGASHVVMVSHPDAVVRTIVNASVAR